MQNMVWHRLGERCKAFPEKMLSVCEHMFTYDLFA